MSRKETDRNVSESGEILAVIREEQLSPTTSSVNMDTNLQQNNVQPNHCQCFKNKQIPHGEIDASLKEQEKNLREEYDKRLDREIQNLKERFDFILENEQIRTSYMLGEAHRERKEKISALQTQLECKNLAGLMYVLCSERRKSKLEKMQMAQEYTKYIDVLQETLIDAQALILRLVNGYKTGSKIDESWRNKMKEVMKEYQCFVNNFVNDTPEMNQYFFDLAKLIDIELPVFKPVDVESEISVAEPKLNEIEKKDDRPWYDMLEGNNPPFVMFGDMGEFKPNLRRKVLKTLKTVKEPPNEWQHYIINDKFVRSQCPNAGHIKDEYLKVLRKPGKWECSTLQTEGESTTSQRLTQASIDLRGNMGSILKIIASTAYGQPATRATILGARDSMEIASTTKLREKVRTSGQSKVVINVGNKRVTKFEDYPEISQGYEEVETIPRQEVSQVEEDEIIEESFSALGSIHNDSLHVIPSHVPDQDAKINNEKVCPMEECQRMQVDSFIRSLPPYMQANPYVHFENTYELYEPCTPEQLDILRQRIESKKTKSKQDMFVAEESPLQEWDQRCNNVAAQTSGLTLPPCTCPIKTTVEESVHGIVYNIKDLLPAKRALNEINQKFFFDTTIEFNRFKVVGQNGDSSNMMTRKRDNRLYDIQKMLTERPSLCDMFPANAH